MQNRLPAGWKCPMPLFTPAAMSVDKHPITPYDIGASECFVARTLACRMTVALVKCLAHFGARQLDLIPWLHRNAILIIRLAARFSSMAIAMNVHSR